MCSCHSQQKCTNGEPYLRYFLGSRFTIETDKKALAFLQKSDLRNGKVARYAINLQPFDYNIRPIKANIGPASSKKGSSNLGTGKQTLRLRSGGPATVEISDDVVSVATDKINNLLESFMGINDAELAQSIWELGSKANNPHEFTVAIDESDLQMFGFTDDLIFDMWGAISDAKSGRLNKTAEFTEQF